MKRARLIFTSSLVAVDLIMAAVAFWLAYRLRLLTEHEEIASFPRYLPMLVIHVLSIFTVLFFNRMYHRNAGALAHG